MSDTGAGWFEVSEDSFPFSPDVVNNLLKRREALRGSLFFDHMLVLAGIDLGVFPPWSLDDLTVLLQEIDNCEWQDLRKDCMFPLALFDHMSLGLMLWLARFELLRTQILERWQRESIRCCQINFPGSHHSRGCVFLPRYWRCRGRFHVSVIVVQT